MTTVRDMSWLPDGMDVPANVVDRIRAWLPAYVGRFRNGESPLEQALDVKEGHTRRVVDNLLELAARIGLTEPERRVAETAAWLHDVGRFPQLAGYGTAVDVHSVDHARLSVVVVGEEGLLDEVDPVTRRLVLRAVELHNRIRLPEDDPPEVLRCTRLLRDADKLDIWEVLLAYFHRPAGEPEIPGLVLDLPERPGVSPGVLRAVADGRPLGVRDLKNVNDYKMLLAGWLGDLGYPASRDVARERGVLNRLLATLPRRPEIDAALARYR